MKLFCLTLWIAMFASANAMGQNQSVQQTVSYINSTLNESSNKFNPTYYGLYFDSLPNGLTFNKYKCNLAIRDGNLVLTYNFYSNYYSNGHPKEYVSESDTYGVNIASVDLNAYSSNGSKFDAITNTVRKQDKYPSALFMPIKDNPDCYAVRIIERFNQNEEEINQKFKSVAYFQVIFSNDNLVYTSLRGAFMYLIQSLRNQKYQESGNPGNTELPNTLSTINGTDEAQNLSNANTNAIPMISSKGVYKIPVTVNGVLKLNFVFDAGASDVSIPPDVALTLYRTGTVTDTVGKETYKLADGSTIKGKVFIIKELQIGNQKITNVRATIANSINAPLLLGQSVLNRFGNITIDYKKNVIIFNK